MKKQIQRITSLLLTVFVLSSVLMVDVSAEPIFNRVTGEWVDTDNFPADKYVWDDEIGTFVYRWDNISWSFDEETGILVITGEGSMIKDDVFGTPGPGVLPWYKYRDKIKKAVVGEGITELSLYCFSGQSELTEVILPSTLKTIPEEAFSNTKKLDKLIVPNGVTQISDWAFNRTYGMKEFTAPHTAFKNGRAYENGMTNLQKLTITNGADTNKTLVNPVYSPKEFAPWYNTNKELEVVIEEGITTIDDLFMLDCTALRKITIPQSVTTIKMLAFANCDNLKTVIWRGDKNLSSYMKLLDGEVDLFYPHNNETWKNTKITALYSSDASEIQTRLNEWRENTSSVTGDFYWPMSCDGTMPIIDEGYAPDYGKEGLSKGAYCAVCKEVLIEQQVLPALTAVSPTPNASSSPMETNSPAAEVTVTPSAVATIKPSDESSDDINAKPTVTPVFSAKVVKFVKKTVKIKIGKKGVLQVKNNDEKKTTFSVNKKGKKVVKLYKDKKNSVTVKGKKKGIAVITAKVGKQTAKCKVIVK